MRVSITKLVIWNHTPKSCHSCQSKWSKWTDWCQWTWANGNIQSIWFNWVSTCRPSLSYYPQFRYWLDFFRLIEPAKMVPIVDSSSIRELIHQIMWLQWTIINHRVWYGPLQLKYILNYAIEYELCPLLGSVTKL